MRSVASSAYYLGGQNALRLEEKGHREALRGVVRDRGGSALCLPEVRPVRAFPAISVQAEEGQTAGAGLIFLFAQRWFPAKLRALLQPGRHRFGRLGGTMVSPRAGEAGVESENAHNP
jgi:hypothetical protein